MKEWKIGYCASWKCDGSLVNPDKPFQAAYIEAETGPDAAKILMEEFPVWKIKIAKIEEHIGQPDSDV